ncbi:arginine deiminase [Lagierella sp.]|uniref:arginine deiminase n=1 Tax=Lagierella sp. TaxID=2849657 RepID=UPI002612C13C|nr:arginine deiminase [Lagierella sp.]
MTSINVTNEIGKLKKVLLHRPGEELLNMTPGKLQELLFDDIPYLERAAEEHDAFANLLREKGVEVFYLEELMADLLKEKPELKEDFINQLLEDSGIKSDYYIDALREYFNGFTDMKKLVDKSIAGVNYKEIDLKKSEFLESYSQDSSDMLMLPMPNLYFQRDPFSSVGNGVVINKMYTFIRQRETIFAHMIFSHSEKFKDVVKFYDRDYEFSIEGGDVLNINKKTLAVGISQRTQPEAIEKLAKNIFYNSDSEIETVVAIDIPKIRAFMHLDTVFTQIDYDKFTVHPGILETLRVFELKKGSSSEEIKTNEIHDTLGNILSRYLDREVELIYCGGGDKMISEREQWNDGSNTLCISPGNVVVYERNIITNELLRERGVNVLEIRDSELSRGRGGPRCMSMPLIREEIL